MLKITDLHAAYGKAEVLHGIELEVAAGEVVCLIGRNGVGKSSTMKSIVRDQITVTGGEIAFDDEMPPDGGNLDARVAAAQGDLAVDERPAASRHDLPVARDRLLKRCD